MPHAVTLPYPNLQALIFCGPGSSFPTFTANPDENPKALLPVANRPMVWYPINSCYRMGITDITLICPPSASAAITTALNTNPYLTSLPTPRPSVLAPRDLTYTTGTAQILRLLEIRSLITSDFIILPCDLICELPGEMLLQAWMVRSASLRSAIDETWSSHLASSLSSSADSSCLRGPAHSSALGVWYDTSRPNSDPIEDEETDFLAVSPAPGAFSSTPSKGPLLPHLATVVNAMPTDSLKDRLEEEKGFTVRRMLAKRHPRVRVLTSHRDAHVYLLPRWIVDFCAQNKTIETIGEDLIGWWAKASWQSRLAEKLDFAGVLQPRIKDERASEGTASPAERDPSVVEGTMDGEGFANSEAAKGMVEGSATNPTIASASRTTPAVRPPGFVVPPILAYIHPSEPTAPLIRRVDNSALLLNTSLLLARLPSVEEAGAGGAASSLSHARKIAYPEGLAARTTISKDDSLLGDGVTVASKTLVHKSVIGAGCQIGEGVRLDQCLLMEGVVVAKGCRLKGCVLGKGAVVGEDSLLVDCEVQQNLIVEPETDEKGTKLMSSEGLEATEDDIESEMAEMELAAGTDEIVEVGDV